MHCHGASDNVVACCRVFLGKFSCKFCCMACTIDLNEKGYPPGFDRTFWRDRLRCGAAFWVWACALTLKLRRHSALALRLDVFERMIRLRVDKKGLLRASILSDSVMCANYTSMFFSTPFQHTFGFCHIVHDRAASHGHEAAFLRRAQAAAAAPDAMARFNGGYGHTCRCLFVKESRRMAVRPWRRGSGLSFDCSAAAKTMANGRWSHFPVCILLATLSASSFSKTSHNFLLGYRSGLPRYGWGC